MFMKNEKKGIEVRIIDRVQANWEELADHLRLPPHTAANLMAQPRFTPARACREIFNQWLVGESNPKVPKTWQTVIKVICRIGNARLADEITNILRD